MSDRFQFVKGQVSLGQSRGFYTEVTVQAHLYDGSASESVAPARSPLLSPVQAVVGLKNNAMRAENH